MATPCQANGSKTDRIIKKKKKTKTVDVTNLHKGVNADTKNRSKKQQIGLALLRTEHSIVGIACNTSLMSTGPDRVK